MDLIIIFIVGIWFVIGILFIGWAVSFKYNSYRLVKKCTNKCEGILVKINEIKIHRQLNESETNWYTTKSYVPIYEYEVQQKKYKIKGTNGSGFRKGDIVEINYNPDNPEESYIEGYSFIAWIVLLVLGLVFISIALFFYFLVNLS